MTDELDMWDAHACGLTADPDGVRLASVRTGADRARPRGRAATYSVGAPAYVPYRSTTVPCPDLGREMAESIMQAVHAPELLRGIETSPLADIALRTAA